MKRFPRFLGLASLMALFLVLAGSRDAAAQSFKVGYTDHEIIIAQMPDFQQIQGQLQQLAQSGQEEYQRRATEFQAKLDDFQKKQAVMAQNVREQKEQELARIQGELQQYLQRKEMELAEKQGELMQPIFDKVQKAIDDVAKENNLDMVLSMRAGETPIMLYRNEQTVMDLTEAVMRKLGMTPPAPSAAK